MIIIIFKENIWYHNMMYSKSNVLNLLCITLYLSRIVRIKFNNIIDLMFSRQGKASLFI